MMLRCTSFRDILLPDWDSEVPDPNTTLPSKMNFGNAEMLMCVMLAFMIRNIKTSLGKVEKRTL